MKTSQVVITTLSLLGAAGVGYAIYFDHRRRNDAAFRKSLKKDSKRTSKISKRETERQKAAEDAAISSLLEEIRAPGGLPTGVEEKEQYFLQHVALGEQLFAQGQDKHLDASIAFFRALKVYPAPVELIMIYQKAVPKEVFDCIMRIVSKDIAAGGGEEPAGVPAQNIENLDDVDEEGSAAAAEPVAEEEATSAQAPAPQTDSGSLQEWDTLSATSLNETGVIVTPNPASSVQGETESESTATASTAEAEAETEAQSTPAFTPSNDWSPAPVFGEAQEAPKSTTVQDEQDEPAATS